MLKGFDLFAIAEHLHPALATDGAHDIPGAARAHTAELDREAAEGMGSLPAAGELEGQHQAATDLDAAIDDARRRGATVIAGFAIDPLPLRDPLTVLTPRST